MKKPIKPEKYYKNLNDYLHKSYFNNSDLEFPCIKCRGYGWYQKHEEGDCYDGMKYAPKYKCEKCNETGIGTKSENMKEYSIYLNGYKSEVAQYKKDLELYKSIKSKLTKEELEFLK